MTIVHRESEPAYPPWAKWISIAAHLAVVVVACSLFAFAQPLADDYCSAASRQGVTGHVGDLYRTWSGRWLSHSLEHLALTHVDPTQIYGSLTGLLSLVLAPSLYLFARSLFRGSLAPRLVFSLCCSFLVLFWGLHPSLGQSFFWLTGAIEYQLVVSFALLLFAGLLSESLAASRGLVRALRAASLSLLAFLICGMHELFATMLCVVLVAAATLAYRVQHPNRTIWVFVLAAGVAGFLVVAGAPGNLVRTASFAGDRDLPLALWLTLWQAIKAGTKWILDLKLVAATLVFLVDPRIRAAQPRWLNAHAHWRRIIPVTWLAILAVGFAMPTFATGQEIPRRALGGLFLVFLLGWFISAFVLTRDLPLGAGLAERDFRKLGTAFLLLFSLSVLATGNTRHGLHDLVHTAPAWDRALHERYELIREGKRDGTVTISVPPAPPWPRTFFQGPADITSDWKDWKNACMASFFDVPAVQVGPE